MADARGGYTVDRWARSTLVRAGLLATLACHGSHDTANSPSDRNVDNAMSTAFEWYPSLTGPTNLPMKALQGAFTLRDGKKIGLPTEATVDQGWGEPGDTELREPQFKGVPVRVDVLWFSYAEDAFYRASLALPDAVIEPLLAGEYAVPTPAGTAKYDGIVVGLAPEGIMSVWVTGPGQRRRVAQGTGSRESADWKTYHPDMAISREQHISNELSRRLGADALAALRRAPVTGAFWRDAGISRTLQPVITGATTVEQVTWRFADGETEQLLGKAAMAPEARPRSVPTGASVTFSLAGGIRYRAEVSLNAPTMLALAQKLAGDRTDAPLVVSVDVSGAPGRITASARSRETLVPLQGVRFEIEQR